MNSLLNNTLSPSLVEQVNSKNKRHEKKIFMHIDCNNFFANVELMSYPHLISKPVAVAGDPRKRHGIILAKNSIAKNFSIQTAETIYSAITKCPHLVILPANMWKYTLMSKKLNSIYRRFSCNVETFSIDESFMEINSTWHLFANSPLKFAKIIKDEIYKQTKCTVSIGISDNKILAKLASDFKSEKGISMIFSDKMNNLDKLPVESLMNIGKHTKELLEKYNIETLSELLSLNSEFTYTLFGKSGLNIKNNISGQEIKINSILGSNDGSEENKSISLSRTFSKDISDFKYIDLACRFILDCLTRELKNNNRGAKGLAIYIRFSDFDEAQKQYSYQYSRNKFSDFFSDAISILIDLYRLKNKPIRKIGLKLFMLSELSSDNKQINLDELYTINNRPTKETNFKLEYILNNIRNEFGYDSLFTASQIYK